MPTSGQKSPEQLRSEVFERAERDGVRFMNLQLALKIRAALGGSAA